MQTTIILLVEQIVTALGGEFKVFWLQYMSILRSCGTSISKNSSICLVPNNNVIFTLPV